MFYKFLIIASLFQFIYLNNVIAQKKVSGKNYFCLIFLERYSEYWKRDSVGKDGVREIIANEFLSKCNFVGEQWNNLAEDLGTPNQKYTIEDKSVYRYRLNHYSTDIKEAGTMLLDIKVNAKGIITRFSIYSVDG